MSVENGYHIPPWEDVNNLRRDYYYDSSSSTPENYRKNGHIANFYKTHNEKYERSGSFCSTCPSEDLTDSDEDEDAAVRWPWTQHIQDNGDLIFIQSQLQDQNKIIQKDSQHQNSYNNENKEKGIQGKLKHVIKKSRSFTKKDFIDRNVNINQIKMITQHKKKEVDKIQDPLKDAPEIQTTTNDGITLICKNVVLQLKEKVQESFANLENVIGVISGLDLDPVLDDFVDNVLNRTEKYNSDLIVVQGIIPNSAVCDSEVCIGDIILAINGIKVNQQTVNSIVEKINGTPKIVLTIERVVPTVEPEKPSELCSIVSNTLEGDMNQIFNAYNEKCAAALLTLSTNEEDANGDILFWYPDCENSNVIKSVRGMFLTISDILVDITGADVESSVLYVNNEVINVSYKKIGENVFVVAAPEKRCSLKRLKTCTGEFIELLFLVNGDSLRSFDEEHLSSTRHMIALFMDFLLRGDTFIPFGSIRQLQLSMKNNIEMSNVLCDLEAADYGECVDDFFPHRRLYGTIGTCLFYKDNLVCSHLTHNNFNDVVTFCKYHWLFFLAKTEKLKQLVVWKEIFLTKNKQDIDRVNIDFLKPSNARWFILVVGQGHSLFCTLLEAGGAASVPDGNPGPHPYYVDTAWSILSYLNESIEYENICNTRLNGPSIPAIVKPSEALNPKTSASPRAIELIKRKVPIPREHDQLSMQRSVGGDSDGVLTRERSHSRSSNMSGSSNRTFNGQYETQTHFKSMSISSSTEVSTTTPLSTKLTNGLFNTLFYFTILTNFSGVFVCPNSAKVVDKLSAEILRHYTSSCKQIHEWFQSKQPGAEPLEHGMLFSLQSTKGAEIKKGFPNVRYWVVGRLLKRNLKVEEVYACFQDGTPQNIVEMAFKVRFGCYY